MSEENRENKPQETSEKAEGKSKKIEENEAAKSEEEEITTEETVKENEKNPEAEKTIKDLEEELGAVKDKMLRVLAESENTRKQIEKNRIDTAKYGVQPLARELINVVDNFERALNSLSEKEEKRILEGFELIQKEIINILDKFYVKKIDALGKAFDANIHQAMFEKPSEDFDSGTVCEIVQDGYMFHDRLLRPVMVGICKNVQKNGEDDKKEKNQSDEQGES